MHLIKNGKVSNPKILPDLMVVAEDRGLCKIEVMVLERLEDRDNSAEGLDWAKAENKNRGKEKEEVWDLVRVEAGVLVQLEDKALN
jgi:hypothetical protein